MKTQIRVQREFILDLGCNLKCTVQHSLINSDKPTVILSNGYGTIDFNRPVVRGIIRQIEKLEFNWLHYRYPEREPGAVSASLYISSGLSTLRAVYNWLIKEGFQNIGLFGISFGANISFELSLLEKVNFLVLVNPVIDYVAFRTKQLGCLLLEQWCKNGRIDLKYEDGEFECYYRFMEEAQHQKLAERLSNLQANTIVFQAEYDELIDLQASQIALSGLSKCTYILVPNAKHAFNQSGSIALFEFEALNFLQEH